MEDRLWHKSYAPGVKKTLEYEKITLSQALTRSAEKFPNHTALNYMGKKITYRELNELVNCFARALIDMGVKPEDKIAVCLPNIPQVIISNLAILRIGAVAVQNNPLYTERELAYQLNDSDSKLMITLTLLIPRIQKIKPNTQINKIIGCHINTYLPFPKKQLFPFVKKDMYRKVEPTEDVRVFGDLIGDFSSEPVEDASQWDELAALLYTGGTTGVSKGVMLSHANLSCDVQQFAAWFPDIKPGEERLMGNFPVFHIAGFAAIQNFITWQGWENIMVPRPEPKINIELIKKHKPNISSRSSNHFCGFAGGTGFQEAGLFCYERFFFRSRPSGGRHHQRSQ